MRTTDLPQTAPISLDVEIQSWPLREPFTISRGSRTQAQVITVTLSNGVHQGRGECVPYARYGETMESVQQAITSQAGALASGLTRQALQHALPPGAARNALDCALWELEARTSDKPVWQLAGLPAPQPALTAFTISLDAPKAMANAAAAAQRPLLKLKLGGAGDAERLRAVRAAAPDARLIVDANEAWREDELEHLLAVAAETGVELVEQPLPAGRDGALANCGHTVPICADESVHSREDLPKLKGLYDAINIKLDKTGGLSEAMALSQAARAQGFGIMIGCMVGTSLAMAPATLLAPQADFVDLDGPLLLARDRDHPLHYIDSKVQPADHRLWGNAIC